jgi:putative transcriptional regulator
MDSKIDRDQQRLLRQQLAEAAGRGELRLPEAIRSMRQALGLNQEAFGKLFKLTRRQVSELENGSGDPKVSTLNKIGRAFGMTVGFVPGNPS